MAHKIQFFELTDGSKVAIEVAAAPGEEERIASRKDVLVEETGRRFADSLAAAQQAAAEVLSGFRTKLKPDELELTFGFKFSGTVGAVLASSEAEATITLKVKWTNKPSD